MLHTAAPTADDLAHEMLALGRRARAAARRLATATAAEKRAALAAMAAAVRAHVAEILAANAIDVAEMKVNGQTAAFLDRGTLTEPRVEAIAAALDEIAALPDPVGKVLAAWDRPNGLHIERVATPLGVIGIIYESRPNVTADAGALALMAGNAAILRCGSDSYASSEAILTALREGLSAAGLPEDAIQLVPTRDRAAVGMLLGGLGGTVDVIVPRGGKSLVARVQAEARVPVFAHLEGICHVYVDKAADLDMAIAIAVNAKLRRTGVCGSAETLLVDRAVAATHLAPILDALAARGCAIRGSDEVVALWPAATPASEEDWRTEYLDAIISVTLVDGVEAAIEHVETYGSHHTEAIVTADPDTAERFLNGIDSAIVLHNASTQFADGGEFGMGAEIGIATGKMHARGPVGVEQLTSFKYRVRGNGQLRP
ncbi:glutamate-5-semialdehyde dehydrogenase [Oharaeibacter diazotrophicus]|uniref:Gamma-glutamyl phosphate reductase n=2 Tax=Oharaeibacter diazotrophicus TaxID=1920512 RepID=A0A4R6R7P2_9HYPH|nr:glutamate-5-semialdehyde dehydrogenase [Oharaeibacter diazotrophicus]TDP81864.1 glutamate-5-semialdehyde dehydrogenase [Oharaeibacter diazotrophicus]BBE73496.1 gamma-glutamyl phosphate reductase [Pleomorphomonas sp. SM30]GLS75285.1 gamma-glutamyl phosphate reductase [Oharaeibacter diazotrophicus]